MANPVLDKFAVTEADRIGFGGESQVFRLPEGRMLRVYRDAKDRKLFLQMLKVLYEGLEGKFSFKTPRMLELGEEDGTVYSVNEFIEGRAMNTSLKELNTAQKILVFKSYFSAMEELRGVAFPERPYGQILGESPTTGETWTEFLEKSIRRQAKENEEYLGRDIEDFPELVERIVAEAQKQEPYPEKSLVHGDFFPNNVLVNDELEVTGVIDMSGLTVVGDYMVDVASSYIFLETTPGIGAEEAEIYKPMVLERYGESAEKAFDFYNLYYSIYFGINEGPEAETYPMLYEWALRTLKKFQKS